MIKKLFEKLTGLDKVREKVEAEVKESMRLAGEAKRIAEEAETYAKKAQRKEELSKLTPKERATELGEPWVAVLDTKVNADNPRNGFFELDWNDHFVVQLKNAGYSGENDEEVVDGWFKMLCRDIGSEDGMDMDRRGAGYINVNNLGNGKSEIS